MLFRDPARARFSFHTTHGHSPCHHPRRHARLKVYPHLPHRLSYKTPQPASQNSPATTRRRRDSRKPRSGRLARQSKTSRTTTSNAPTSNAPTSNALTSNAPTSNVQERESRNKTLKKTSRNEDQNARETRKSNGQHALNSRSPLVVCLRFLIRYRQIRFSPKLQKNLFSKSIKSNVAVGRLPC